MLSWLLWESSDEKLGALAIGGVDGSITAIQFGVGKQIDTNTLRDPIIGFTFKNKGLMGGVSLEASKFWKDGDPVPKKLAAN